MTTRHEGHGRRPWIAALLSLCCTGLGHVYAGRTRRGLVLFLLSLLFAPLLLLIWQLPPSRTALLLFVATVLGVVLLFLFAVFDAWRVARAQRAAYAPTDVNRPSIYVLFVLVGLLTPALSTHLLRTYVVRAYKVASKSMQPGLRKSDRILVALTASKDVHRGDVVIFRDPENAARHFVKRVVGLPGDEVSWEGPTILVNGEALPPASTSPTEGGKEPRIEAGMVTVAHGDVFVLGDNHAHSKDSRSFGPVPCANLVGRVRYRFWPLSAFGLVGQRSPDDR